MSENKTNEVFEDNQWHALAVQEVVETIGTDLDSGLSDAEAKERLERYGPNVMTKGKHTNYLLMFLKQFTDPLVLVLLAAALITLLLRDYIDTGVILAVVIINAIIGFVQEEKAESAIESLSKMLRVECMVLRGGSPRKISAEDLVPGDTVVLQSGDKVPADLRLAEERNLRIDESILTGESAPVSKSTAPVEREHPVSDRVCMTYSGTLVTGGQGKGVVIATGDATELGKISELISAAPEIATPLTRRLARFGRWLSAVVIGIAAITYVIGVAMGHPAQEMFSAAIAIAVAMIPEGLPAIVTIVLAVGVKRMADRNAIIRTLPSVETLGSVTVICSDKTGTLTANEMTVHRANTGGHEYEFAGIGYDPSHGKAIPTDTDDTELTSEAFIECLRCGLLCNESTLVKKDDEWIPSGDPTEVALITAAMKGGLDQEKERKERPQIGVIPFESSNMYMATMHRTPDGTKVLYVKGSLEKVLGMCSSQVVGSEEADLDSQHMQDRAEDLACQGYRILAFARKTVDDGVDSIDDVELSGLSLLGIQAISDPARPEATAAVRECREAGIKVKMITGDHVATARSIACDMGIGGADPMSATGSELEAMTDEEFEEAARSSSVFARVAPEQKYRLVEKLQANGEIVAMTGDGVNDAPALKKADIGVAMGKAGSDIAKDASDMVLTDDNFASIVAAVEEGRTVFSNLLKTLAYILPTNAGEGLIIILALLGGQTLPITPVQILWINTVTTVTLALPLAFEPREPGLMTVPPRETNMPIVSGAIMARIITVGLYMVGAAFAIFLTELGREATIEQARTAAVTTIVAIEAVYLFVARSERIPVWKLGFFSNPYVWVGVPIVALLQLGFIYIPLINLFFRSAPIDADVWLRIALVSIPVVVVVLVERAIVRRFLKDDVVHPEETAAAAEGGKCCGSK